MTKQKLVIDADPGIGDAIAIALALCDPNLEVVALTSTAGLVSGEQAFINLQTVTSLLDPQRWPKIGWSDSGGVKSVGMDRSQSFPPFAPALSGILGEADQRRLGECEPLAAPLHQPTHSAKLLVELAKEYSGDLIVLTLGPLTNVRAACELDPRFFTHIKELVIAGGAVSAGGDVTAVAEFNVFADPESAREVFSSQANCTLLPIDVTHQFGIGFDEYADIGVDAFSRLGRLLDQTIPFALRLSRNQLGYEGILLPEVVAVTAIAHPELFELSPMTIDVELAGDLTRGMTVFDRRRLPHWKENIEVIHDADLLGVKDYMLRLIRSSSVM